MSLSQFKTRITTVSLILSTVFTFISCGNEVPIAADWQEKIVIYGLIDPEDSVQYFRIEKAYLDPNTSALITAKESDSLILSPADVVLRLVKDTNVKFNLQRVNRMPKDSGLFGNDQNYLWKTTQPILANEEYEIQVTSTKTGQRVWARTRTLSSANISAPVKSNANIFSLGTDYITFEWLPRSNSYAYDVKMEVVYDEFPSKDTFNKKEHTLKWDVLTNYVVSANKLATARVPRLAFMQFLNSAMKADSSISRRIKYVNFLFYGGNQTLADYISVNRPSIGIVQKTAEYTNINGGYGIFASRCFQPIRQVRVSQGTIKVLQTNPETTGLRFVY